MKYIYLALNRLAGTGRFQRRYWKHFIPAGSSITAIKLGGPLKWCRVDEKSATKRFTALIFWFFCIKAKEQVQTTSGSLKRVAPQKR